MTTLQAFLLGIMVVLTPSLATMTWMLITQSGEDAA